MQIWMQGQVTEIIYIDTTITYTTNKQNNEKVDRKKTSDSDANKIATMEETGEQNTRADVWRTVQCRYPGKSTGRGYAHWQVGKGRI
jgi:hypothetical protein